MGLIARALEASGVVTTSVSAARDITAAGRLPRAVFVDFPHGHSTGKVGQPALSEAIVRSALELTASDAHEQLIDLPHRWADADDWKDLVFAPTPDPDTGDLRRVDDRTERRDTPQYQSDGDSDAADAAHAAYECTICAGLDY